MNERVGPEVFCRLQPILPRSLEALGDAVEKSGLDKRLIELVKIRASQINGCAFCLNMHSVDARKLGESQERLDLVPAWREARCFSARERAALAWTEALTLISAGSVPDEIYGEAARQFSAEELANLTAAIVAINGWNRIAVAFRFEAPVAAP